MARVNSADAERESVMSVARLMATAARTAPKARGVDAIDTLIVEGQDLEALAHAMDECASGRPSAVKAAFHRDADSLRKSTCAILLSVTGEPKKPENPFDCGACGFSTCQALIKARANASSKTDFFGPVCVYASLDLGVALGSAVQIAGSHNIDNRMMYTMGVAAGTLNWMKGDVILGIPLSSSGKNIYFDRG
ncbi:MAG: ferredoxin domain-containing protein [Chloroflexota bacterium]